MEILLLIENFSSLCALSNEDFAETFTYLLSACSAATERIPEPSLHETFEEDERFQYQLDTELSAEYYDDIVELVDYE